MATGWQVAAWAALGLAGGAGALLGGGGAFAITYLSIFPVRRRIRVTPERFGAPYEEVSFSGRDGTRLVGWYVPHPAPRAVLVLSHGMWGARTEMLPWAEWLWKAGYALLMFDFRALGESDGRRCTMGLHEPGDVLGAVDYLNSRPDTAGMPYGILGFSMGATSAILAAAQDERLRAVVAHGAYASLNHGIVQRCRRHFGPFGPFVERQVRWLGRTLFRAQVEEVCCLSVVDRIAPRPLLLLNGARDPVVPPHNAHEIYEAASGPKKVVILPHSRHPYPHPSDEPGYRREVLSFLDQAFARQASVQADDEGGRIMATAAH